MRIASQGYFYVGGRYGNDANGGLIFAGQMYVEYQLPTKSRLASKGRLTRHPLVFIHGGGHTGACWQSTPDGRPGWPDYFLGKGWPVYVVDQPGRGRSPAHPGRLRFNDGGGQRSQGAGQLGRVGEGGEAAMAAGRAPYSLARRRGAGRSRLRPVLCESVARHRRPEFAGGLTTQALVALLDRIGPAVLVAHSQPGPAVWRVADLRPELVRAIVAVKPSGPPFYECDNERGQRDRPYGPSRGAFTYEPPLHGADELQLVRQQQPDGPGLAACWLQAEPARQLPRLAGRPILFLLSEASYHAPYDHCTSLYLKQAGVDNELVRLTDLGIHGNGHLMMIEDNSLELAAWVERWLVKRLASPRRKKPYSRGRNTA